MTEDTNKVRIGKLHSLGGVLKELGRVYREARRGELDDQTAVRLASILREMRACLEASAIEGRLRALEEAARR